LGLGLVRVLLDIFLVVLVVITSAVFAALGPVCNPDPASLYLFMVTVDVDVIVAG